MSIEGSNARAVKILSSSDWSTWGEIATGGSTVTVSSSNGGTNNRITCDSVASSRACKSEGYTVDASKWYVFSVDVISVDPTFDDDCEIRIVTVPSSGDQFLNLTSANNGQRVVIKFQPSASGSLTFRVGNGVSSNRGAGTSIFENVQVQEFDSEPTLVDKYYESTTSGREVYTNYNAASTISSNVMTEVTPTTTFSLHPFAIVAFMGDSFGNDTGEYPDRVKFHLDRTDKTIEFYNGHVPGEQLDDIGARIFSVMSGASLPSSFSPLFVTPQVVVLQGGVNDAIADQTKANMISRLDANINTAIDSGASRIVIVNIGPFGNSVSHSSARQTVVDAYNAEIGLEYKTYQVYDMYSALEGDANPDDLSDTANGDTYDYNGDDLHPNTGANSGSDRIGQDLAAIIQYGYNFGSTQATATVAATTRPQNVIFPIPDQRRYKIYKHSDSVDDYQVNWQEYLGADESISSQALTANNVTVDSSSSSGQVTTMFVSGGDPETNAYVDISITTDNATARTYKIRLYFYFEYPTQYKDSQYYY